MTRVLSGAVLIAVVVVVVWLAPRWVFLAVSAMVTIVATSELIQLARVGGLMVAPVPAFVGSLLTMAAMSPPRESIRIPLDATLMTAVIALALVMLGAWRGGGAALASISAALFPMLYVALPVGALAAIRAAYGPAVLFLLMLTVMVSDTAQFYTGRLVGRHALAPAISPKKTVEGAVGGLVFGTLLFVVLGTWWIPRVPLVARAGLGVIIVGVGIAGDLFESMLKRSAGVKDSSKLIPGHGGILDRVDALLFAAPVYYLFLAYA